MMEALVSDLKRKGYELLVSGDVVHYVQDALRQTLYAPTLDELSQLAAGGNIASLKEKRSKS